MFEAFLSPVNVGIEDRLPEAGCLDGPNQVLSGNLPGLLTGIFFVWFALALALPSSEPSPAT